MNIIKFSKKLFMLKKGEYAGINLTAINSFEEFYVKQIEDSLRPLEFNEIKKIIKEASVIVDLGFGGGYPLLPMAFAYSDKKIYGIDARNKKVRVVQEIANKVGLKNIKTIHNRIENINFDKDVVLTVKAVGKINEILKKISTTKTIYVIFFKGKKVDEIEPIEKRANSSNWEEVFAKDYRLSNENKRKVIVYKNKNVPCGTIKKLVNLSELL